MRLTFVWERIRLFGSDGLRQKKHGDFPGGGKGLYALPGGSAGGFLPARGRKLQHVKPPWGALQYGVNGLCLARAICEGFTDLTKI